jgi:VanZ family protein
MLFALYASVVPLDFRPLPVGDAVARFGAVLAEPVRVESRSDWLANILLILPVGYLLAGALLVDRPRRSWLWAVPVVPVCGVVAAMLEFAQLYFPPRVSSVNDIVAQTLGAAVGVALWVAAGPRLTDLARVAWHRVDDRSLALRLLPGYLVLLLLLQTVPLDVIASPVDLYRKLRDGGVCLLAPAFRSGDGWGLAVREAWELAAFVPLGVLAAYWPGWTRRGVLSLGLAVAGGVELVQLFIASHSCAAADVLIGALAVLGGWWVAVRLRDRTGWGSARSLGLAAWMAMAVLVAWAPFDFTADAAQVPGRVAELWRVPLADYERTTPFHALDESVHKGLLFLVLGILLASPGASRRPRALLLRGVMAPAAVATAMELGQLLLPTRYASVSDVLVETAAAAVGFALVRHFSRDETTARDAGRAAGTRRRASDAVTVSRPRPARTEVWTT